jgi:hypothetical protein
VANGKPRKYARRAPRWLLLAIVSAAVTIGVCLAVFNRGSFADLRAALSALIPARLGGFGTSCH